jgi:acyl-CoA synthetase (NDP forming)
MQRNKEINASSHLPEGSPKMNLKKIFEPGSMAVVGISHSNPFNPANVIYNKNNLRYQVKAYGINPRGGRLYGERVYKSISHLPEKVDLAVLSIRAEFVPKTLRECIKAGVSAAIIISGGFAETGRSDLQDEIRSIASKSNFPIIGPNCLGIFSPPHIDTFFLPNERLIEPRVGNVALISQSGGILVDQIIKLTQEGVGLSRAISIGNKAVVDEIDMLRFFKRDEKTRVIGIYLEGFKAERGRTFIEEVNSIKKPVVILKAGKTTEGSRAVNSHTASLAGDYFVFSEVLKDSHAIEAENELEFISYCEALSTSVQKAIKNVGIITSSGGHGAIAADGCYSAGLHIAEVPGRDRSALKKTLSNSVQEIASFVNPIDMTGSANDNDFLTATKFFLEKDYIDCIILLLLPYLPGITSDIGARIAQLAREYKKPIITYLPHVEKYGIFIEGFESNGIPVAHSVDGAVYMAKGLTRRV